MSGFITVAQRHQEAAKPSFKPTEEQEDIRSSFKAMDQKEEQGFLTIQAGSGTGKAQPVWCKVQTPTGERNIGDLAVGDDIFRRDGTVGKVIGVFPQEGMQQTYRVTFRDGTFTHCNKEHLWTVYGGKWKDKEVVRSLEHLLLKGIRKARGGRRFNVPLCAPIQYKPKQYLIDPYTLGILIGDGALEHTLRISVGDKDAEIVNFIRHLNPKAFINGRRTAKGCMQYSFTDTTLGYKNNFKTEIVRLGLNVKSGERFIPQEYMLGSAEQRLELLRGLMDSDGSCVKNRTSFTTTSMQLNLDIRKLIRSLGGIATGSYVDLRKSTSVCYTVQIRMPVNPFKVQSKASLWSYSSKNPPAKYIDSVELVGEDKQVCIAVDAPDQLYLTDDFIVTHNTSTLLLMANDIQESILYLAFNKSMADEMKRKAPWNMECRTMNSICYQYLDEDLRFKLTRPEGKYVNVALTPGEIAKTFKISNIIDRQGKVLLTGAMMGLMIKQTITKYEYSDDQHIGNKHFPRQHIEDLERKGLKVDKITTEVVKYAKKLWRERIDPMSKVCMTHDTYVKLFQLSGQDLGYDVIFGDEFQDVNPAFLSILRNAKSAKKIVVVGDQNQAIYMWRGASNMMIETAKYGEELPLTTSFRFGPRVAAIANKILSAEKPMAHPLVGKGYDTVVGSPDSEAVDITKPHTIIFRKNLTMLLAAMDALGEGKSVNVNADVKDFVQMIDSVNALRKGDLDKVKHETIIPYASWEDFVEGAESDPDAKRLLNIIVKGNAQAIAHTLRNHKNDKNALITMISGHRSKGLEYDQVILANDFPSNYNKEGEWVGLTDEERNLLYVATTRAIKALQWNSTVDEILKAAALEEECTQEVKYINALEEQLAQSSTCDVIDKLDKEVDYEDANLKQEFRRAILTSVSDQYF